MEAPDRGFTTERPFNAGGWPAHLRKARVYEQILMDIVMGDLPPGARLDEGALTGRYGAGLAGVRGWRWRASSSAGRDWAPWSARWTCTRSARPSSCGMRWRARRRPWLR